MVSQFVTRRKFLGSTALSVAGAAMIPLASNLKISAATTPMSAPLEEFDYGQVSVTSELHEAQLQHCVSVLMGLNEDSLLKPMRQMAGLPAPGADLGGWYIYDPNYDTHSTPASRREQLSANGSPLWRALMPSLALRSYVTKFFA